MVMLIYILRDINSIEFRDSEGEVLWELHGDIEFNSDFMLGFMYAALYGREHTTLFPNNYSFGLVRRVDMFFVRYLADLKFRGYLRSERLHEISNRSTIDKAEPGSYVIWLRKSAILGRDAVIWVNFHTIDFIQGLLTALNSFNIDPTELILTKPYKDGIFYDIQGLNLPFPDVYYNPNRR